MKQPKVNKDESLAEFLERCKIEFPELQKVDILRIFLKSKTNKIILKNADTDTSN